ncbi:DUF3071 domain-containing protein [Actinocorallia sp. API 0066]|uniref:septation protein SepH n=1 Tax=Actinocorallia sp. API 0066 TaxID=2896846 RepID=UPI001E4DC4CE|nr:septation protein SepH [Actinocorallia sp. API 0066]MCD0451958.1 DUF3071 domain-containing protein [Actinocorallia sp. API 0066]
MQELRLVAVSEDGSYLVLATAGRGTRFTLPVDDRLRAAVRGHFSRLGQFEIEVESPLRPKEIQARIRAGETAEEIAESAGIPVERVRWFEGPVLQEREYMAQQAQRCVVRTPGEPTPGPPLGELVEERLGRRGADLEEVTWDAWKCEDNTWQIRLSFYDAGRPHAAEWKFDPRRRAVRALDDEASRLIFLGEEEPEPPADTVTPLRRPAMKIVSDQRRDPPAGRPVPAPFSQRPDLDDALPSLPTPPLSPEPFTPERFQREMRAAEVPDLDALSALLDATAPAAPAPPSPPEEAPAPPAEPGPAALTPDRPEAAEDAPGPVVTPPAPPAEPEPAAVVVTPPAPREPAAVAEAAPPAEPVAPPAPEPRQPAPAAAEPVRTPAPEPEPVLPPEPVKPKPQPAPVPAATAPPKPEPRPRKRPARNRRASVPSWDEIMFGARRPD